MRAAVQQGQNAYNEANQTANQNSEQASQISSSLVPGLEREAATPTGYTPQEMSDQLVASEQGAGGANAGITGQANLEAARTRNSSALSGVLDSAARDKTRQLSQNALDIQNKSATLGQQKQMAAQSELGKLYGIDTSADIEAQGLMPQDIKAEADANQTGWFQNMIAAWNQGNNTLQSIGKLMGGGA